MKINPYTIAKSFFIPGQTVKQVANARGVLPEPVAKTVHKVSKQELVLIQPDGEHGYASLLGVTVIVLRDVECFIHAAGKAGPGQLLAHYVK